MRGLHVALAVLKLQMLMYRPCLSSTSQPDRERLWLLLLLIRRHSKASTGRRVQRTCLVQIEYVPSNCASLLCSAPQLRTWKTLGESKWLYSNPPGSHSSCARKSSKALPSAGMQSSTSSLKLLSLGQQTNKGRQQEPGRRAACPSYSACSEGIEKGGKRRTRKAHRRFR